MWNKPEDEMHHMITDEIIKKWTNDAVIERVIRINVPKSRRRVIHIFNF